MRLLVAVKSCERDLQRGCHRAIRETWGKDFPSTVDVRFFVGNGGGTLASDEIRVNAEDSITSLPIKVREIAKWVVEHGYDFVYLCDTDTFIIPARLLASSFEQYDYMGRFCNNVVGEMVMDFYDARYGWHPVWAYTSGGVGYFLSQRAAKLIAQMEPAHWAEDVSVGHVLSPLVKAKQLTAFNPPSFEEYAAWHYCSHGNGRSFDLGWMRKMYAEKGRPQ